MPKLERTVNGYAVQGRETYIFRVGRDWYVSHRTWSGARGTKIFRRFADAKRFALGAE